MTRAGRRGRLALEAAALAGAGALQSLAVVHTAAWWAPPLAVGLLVWRLGGCGPGRAALLGGAFGTGWLLASVWWLFVSLHRYGGLPAPLAAGAVLLLCAALSLYLAAAAAAYSRWRSGRPGVNVALFTALWVLAEWARAMLFTGFPWAASGYTQIDGPLAALAPWVGVYGMGAALAALGASMGHWFGSWAGGAFRATGGAPRSAWVLPAAALLGLAALALTGPRDFTQSAGRLGVSLIQTDVAQDEKFAAERMPTTLAWLAQALRDAPGPLVVAPETAVPLLPGQLDELAPGWWEAVQALFPRQAGGAGRAALVGRPLGDYEAGYTNSVVGLVEGRQTYRYDKVHLVPFGEFIPAGFRWFTDLMNIPLGDFNRGPRQAPSFAFLGQRLAPNVCYEDLFGEELAVRFVEPAAAPTALVNVSNIAWFGDTIAIPQHLNISRMRALELQRPMLRATNTGATALIDHRGRVTHALPPFTRGVLDATFEGRSGTTPYAAWAGRWGLWPVAALALAVVAWGVMASARRERPRP